MTEFELQIPSLTIKITGYLSCLEDLIYKLRLMTCSAEYDYRRRAYLLCNLI